jgi:signal transduction histidine kinase
MGARDRWAALVVGALYVAIGVLAWLSRSPQVDGGELPGTVVVFGLWAAIAILAVGFARPDLFQVGVREAGPWLTLAIAAPLALLPLRGSGAPWETLFLVLWPLSVLPLGIVLGGSADRPDATWLLAAMLALAAVVLGIAAATQGEPDLALVSLHLGAIVAISLAPPLSRLGRPVAPDPTVAPRILTGLTPLTGAVVLVLPVPGLAVLAASLLTIAAVTRLALGPLRREASRASAQRDLTVALVEAERRRVAADIHDGPLQSLLLLGRRLDEDGHADAAATARSIADELRDVAGALRLPVLDDLGVGPALDWLAGRIRRMTGIDVTVEYEGLQRPPPEVELAAFRIAQEALSNAVRHGEPPIVVRYRTTGDSVSLSVDDAGRGFSTTIGSGSESYGLMNMIQRAEQIGARLELELRERGMHVGVEWRAASA